MQELCSCQSLNHQAHERCLVYWARTLHSWAATIGKRGVVVSDSSAQGAGQRRDWRNSPHSLCTFQHVTTPVYCTSAAIAGCRSNPSPIVGRLCRPMNESLRGTGSVSCRRRMALNNFNSSGCWSRRNEALLARKRLVEPQLRPGQRRVSAAACQKHILHCRSG